jgi:hypothetical protein
MKGPPMFLWRKKKSAAKPKKAKTPEQIEALLAREGEAFSDSMKKLEQELAEIERIPDAGARYLALEKFNKRVVPMKDEAVERIWEQTGVPKKRLAKTALKWSPVIFFPVIIVKVIEEESKIREENRAMVKRIFQEKGYAASFDAMVRKGPALMRGILKDQMDDLALSPWFDILFDFNPEVKGAFTKAAAKERARKKQCFRLVTPPPPKPQEP